MVKIRFVFSLGLLGICKKTKQTKLDDNMCQQTNAATIHSKCVHVTNPTNNKQTKGYKMSKVCLHRTKKNNYTLAAKDPKQRKLGVD